MYKNKLYNFVLVVASIIVIILIFTDTNIYAETEYHKSFDSINKVQEIKDTCEKKIEKMEADKAKTRVVSSRNVSYKKINSHTDLGIMNTITVDDMNKIIDYWDKYTDHGSPFKNKGQVFIDAAKESGLDPVYILAHAGVESAWGTSSYARKYHNYFGIGAFDADPDNCVNYSNDSLREGIIQGAKWIKRNYYSYGQKSVYSMRYNNGDHEYCTSNDWVKSITNIMKTSYSLI